MNSSPINSSTHPIIEMRGITKRFPGGIVANEAVSLAVGPAELHAIIGENGAGKSTLMNILYGRYQPDEGEIEIGGKKVTISSPAHAISLGLGMVTQHTTMIPALSALDNVILGAEPSRGPFIDRARALSEIETLARTLGIEVEWNAMAESLSIAALQKAEIIKALYRGARILILDEPTATLGPSEADALFELLHTLTINGSTVIFITHKLRDVMNHSSGVTVLRRGRTVATKRTHDTDADALLTHMIGERAETERPPIHLADEALPTLAIKNLTVVNNRKAIAVNQFSLAVLPGEILGVAGVDGSGQRELAEAIIGMRSPVEGRVFLGNKQIDGLSISDRLKQGIAYIPEDRHRDGLVMDFTLAENLLMGRHRDSAYGGGRVIDALEMEKRGQKMVTDHRVRASSGNAHAETLSGGNQQKVVIARALEGQPKLLVAMQPTRGLDVNATSFVYEMIRKQTTLGMGVLLFSLDLDELFEHSDRIAVMYNGGLNGVFTRDEATLDMVGQKMVGR